VTRCSTRGRFPNGTRPFARSPDPSGPPPASPTLEDQRIDTTWRVPGFHENGTWRFERHGPDTLVTHEFRHEGPLARLLSNAYRGVAELRLDRLAQRAAGRPSTLTESP
jgi:hypothetical protein